MYLIHNDRRLFSIFCIYYSINFFLLNCIALSVREICWENCSIYVFLEIGLVLCKLATLYGQQRNNETTNNKTHCSTLKITVLKIRAIQFRNSNKNATDFIYIFNLFTSNILITFTLTSDVKIPLRFVNKFC